LRITAFNVSPNPVVFGEIFEIHCSVTPDAGELIRGPIYARSDLLGRNIYLKDSNFKTGDPFSVAISTRTRTDNQDLLDQLASGRAVADPEWTIIANGTTVATIPNPVTYLNASYKPVIECFSVERSANGLPDDSGENLLLTARLSLSEAADASALRLRLHYAEDGAATSDSPAIDLTDSIAALLGGVTDDTSIIRKTFSNSADWSFLLVFGDDYESASSGASVSEAFANFHLSGASTGGVCVGGFSSAVENAPKFECHYPAYFYGGIALGGMKDISTEEVDTGVKWINGKTIYAKTLVKTGLAGNTTATISLPSDIELVWLDAANSFHVNSSGSIYPPGMIINNVNQFLCLLNTATIVYKTGSSTGGDFYIRILYTKK